MRVAIWSLRERPARSLPPTLEGRSLILIILVRGELAVVHAPLEFIEGFLHAAQLIIREQSRTVEGSGMGSRAGDVVIRKAPVELRGLGESGELR